MGLQNHFQMDHEAAFDAVFLNRLGIMMLKIAGIARFYFENRPDSTDKTLFDRFRWLVVPRVQLVRDRFAARKRSNCNGVCFCVHGSGVRKYSCKISVFMVRYVLSENKRGKISSIFPVYCEKSFRLVHLVLQVGPVGDIVALFNGFRYRGEEGEFVVQLLLDLFYREGVFFQRRYDRNGLV